MNEMVNLTEQQKAIVTAKENKIVVVASAAAGKTRCITERAKWLLDQGIPGEEIVVITFTNAAADEIAKRIGDTKGMFIGTIHSLANRYLRSIGVGTQSAIEEERFDKLFTMVDKHPECIPHVSHLICDETQDSTPIQFKFMLDMINPDNYMLMGDHRQCQPEGTKVLMFDGTEKTIENLQIGDQLIAYDAYKGRITGGTSHNAKNGIISQIAKRLVEQEELVVIRSSTGKVSKYTKNHICITNLCKYDDYNFLVYLMCDKNNRFRVGTSQFKNTRSTPWRAKMIAEGCEKIWILETFKTNKEARVLEDKISYFYRIPQVTFQLDKTTYTQQDIDFIYDGLDTYTAAQQCLKDFHRDIHFPFASCNDNIHYAGNAFNKCYACNILPKNMTVKEYVAEEKHKCRSVDIAELTYEYYNGYVYSLDVENYHSYIADGITTHNSIYQFNGATPQYLIELSKRPEVKVYELNQNYRNADDIYEFAREIISQNGMDYRDNSKPMRGFRGQVITLDYQPPHICRTIKKYKQEGKADYRDWFMLARTNDEVAMIMRDLERGGIPCETFKKAALGNKGLAEKLQENTVKVLTVHSSKGLEAKYVITLGLNFRGSDKEKTCLSYVAATRARDCLVWTYYVKKTKKGPKTYSWE